MLSYQKSFRPFLFPYFGWRRIFCIYSYLYVHLTEKNDYYQKYMVDGNNVNIAILSKNVREIIF